MDLSDPGIELGSPASQADSLPTELSGTVSAGFQQTPTAAEHHPQPLTWSGPASWMCWEAMRTDARVSAELWRQSL